MAHFLLLIALILFPFSTSSQITGGKITVGSSINASENSTPWLSPSGDFAFGFQNFRNFKNFFVLSIWFAKIPAKTIVWFGRTSNPVPVGSILKLDASDGLVLRDPQDKVLYNTSRLADKVAYALMSNTGNFILSTNSTSLWESFNNPFDTILPSQKIEINGSPLISKKTKTDLSNGTFCAGMNADGSFALKNKTVSTNTDFDHEYYNSGSSPGAAHVVFDESTASISVVNDNGQKMKSILSSNVTSSEYYYRATIEFDGVFSLYRFPKNFDNHSIWISEDSLPDRNTTSISMSRN